MGPFISIIIACKNEGGKIRDTIESIRTNSIGSDYEIIVVDDASSDGCCDFLRQGEVTGVTLVDTLGVHANQARNMGAEQAKGEIFIFCDAHIFVEEGWLEKLKETLSITGVDAVSPAIKPHDYQGPHAWGGLTWEPTMDMKWLPAGKVLTPVPVLTAGCLAITKDAFLAVGGFERGFRVYGLEDVEFTLKLWLFGFGAYIEPAVTYRHIFRGQQPYQVNYTDIHFNMLRLAFLHLNQNRLSKIINQLKSHALFSEVFTDVIFSNTLQLRQEYFSRRLRDDDWFMKKFNISL